MVELKEGSKCPQYGRIHVPVCNWTEPSILKSWSEVLAKTYYMLYNPHLDLVKYRHD